MTEVVRKIARIAATALRRLDSDREISASSAARQK
jgi:hypothetical protein